jgi:hypothetical protein
MPGEYQHGLLSDRPCTMSGKYQHGILSVRSCTMSRTYQHGIHSGRSSVFNNAKDICNSIMFNTPSGQDLMFVFGPCCLSF